MFRAVSADTDVCPVPRGGSDRAPSSAGMSAGTVDVVVVLVMVMVMVLVR